MLALLLAAATPQTAVEAEAAMMRAALTQGYRAAFRQFAAPDAVMLLHGSAKITRVVAAQSGVRHVTTTVVSCDGSAAINFGLIGYANGRIGNFQTVWSRTAAGVWRWHVITGDPLPARVVAGPLNIQRAACPSIRPEPFPFAPIARRGALIQSTDGTFAYRWSRARSGAYLLAAGLWNGVAWTVVQFDSVLDGPRR